MDKQITVRFFRIAKHHETTPPFEAALQAAFDSGPNSVDRERDVNGQTIRLENLTLNGACYDGEIVRKQGDNVPPEAHGEGLSPLRLQDDGGLGHSIAFRYSPQLSVIAIQFDNRAVSVNRLAAYLKAFDAAYSYVAYPIIRHDAWERYNRGVPRKLSLRVASPTNLPEVEGEVGAVTSSIRRLAEISDAPVVTIEVSMGHAKGKLDDGLITGILNYFTRGSAKDHDVRKLEVVTAADDDGGAISFLDEVLKLREEITLPRDPDENYSARRNFVARCLNTHHDYIMNVYGGG